MDDHGRNTNSPGGHNQDRSSEPVRTRWNPKPEQIMILDSIFNSGMVNPPKEETARIRMLLEKYGPVGDANVFYWFQNRRSRSRRRQRQMQAASGPAGGGDLATYSNTGHQNQQSQSLGGDIHIGEGSSGTSCAVGYEPFYDNNYSQSSLTSYDVSSYSTNPFGTSSVHEARAENFLVPGQADLPETDQNSSMLPMFCPSETPSLPHHSGYITVFMNGIPTQVPLCPIEVEAVFGQNAIVVHSSGVPLPINEFGFLMQSLEPGESYFLVQRPT